MGGDVGEFHRLWLSATDGDQASGAARQLAGRRFELATVQRHFDSGVGLCVVTGEAGMGKTALVGAARAATDVFVARGDGLPLSTSVPLLPLATMMREIWEHDEGQWLLDALAREPRYVADALATLLPEVEESDAGRQAAADGGRHRMFAAIGRTLTGLSGRHSLALWVEDLHWADIGTLEVLEHLLSRGASVPVVGTYRLDDPDVPPLVAQWFDRVQRLPSTRTLELGPLTQAETAEQLVLLGESGAGASVERIFSRSQGLPLFTEQLAVHAVNDQPLPRLLADVLDRRLEGLQPGAYAVVRTLGVADRPVLARVLGKVTGVKGDALSAVARDLDDRHLLADPSGSPELQLRHPLLAEAVRRRLRGTEQADTHRRLAESLGEEVDVEPAEIAAHWQLAGVPERELVWRVRAAEESAARYDAHQEAEHWLRVLALCNRDPSASAQLKIRATLAAMDALKASLQFDRAAALSAETMQQLEVLEPVNQAEVLLRAAAFRPLEIGDPQVGLDYIERALHIYAREPASAGHVSALERKAILLEASGLYTQARAATDRALEVAAELGTGTASTRLMGRRAWYEAVVGSVPTAIADVQQATLLAAEHHDPVGDIWLADVQTEILLRHGAPASSVIEAGRPGIDAARAAGIENFSYLSLLANVSTALLRAGLVNDAAELIAPLTEGAFDPDFGVLHLVRSGLDLVRGHLAEAAAHVSPALDSPTYAVDNRVVVASIAAEVDLWSGRSATALDRLLPATRSAAATEAASLTGEALRLIARAEADAAVPGRPHSEARRRLAVLREQAHSDPFDSTRWLHARAQEATWHAEMSRLTTHPAIEPWTAAANEWDALQRPFDAAYCRWRAGQAALTSSQGSIAHRLLTRAARDAREHVPLSARIARTSRDAGSPMHTEMSRSADKDA
ncbi:ATP-binding protein [Nocardioides sp. GCM10028917]|uniref:ATP-binding protein n=1 Tax=Nocardioides sp. GCM10028917 TaxID=3273408 RepID=UPI00360D1640